MTNTIHISYTIAKANEFRSKSSSCAILGPHEHLFDADGSLVDQLSSEGFLHIPDLTNPLCVGTSRIDGPGFGERHQIDPCCKSKINLKIRPLLRQSSALLSLPVQTPKFHRSGGLPTENTVVVPCMISELAPRLILESYTWPGLPRAGACSSRPPSSSTHPHIKSRFPMGTFMSKCRGL